jgi:hypothetical protein
LVSTAPVPSIGSADGTVGEIGAGGMLQAPSGVAASAGFQAIVALDSDVWQFWGTAVGGFAIEFTVDGVMLQITTVAGQTAAQVAEAVAAAINQDATLQNLGTTAFTNGNLVITNGNVTDTVINDPGISHGPPIPALSAPATMFLLAALAGVGWLGVRSCGVESRYATQLV